MDIGHLAKRIEKGVYRISKHAQQKCNKLQITTVEIEHLVKTGEIIKEYHDEKPYPECLILGYINDEPHYLVVASNDETVIVTVHEYDPRVYEPDFRTRRKK